MPRVSYFECSLIALMKNSSLNPPLHTDKALELDHKQRAPGTHDTREKELIRSILFLICSGGTKAWHRKTHSLRTLVVDEYDEILNY
jgi:hypothetical protein